MADKMYRLEFTKPVFHVVQGVIQDRIDELKAIKEKKITSRQREELQLLEMASGAIGAEAVAHMDDD